MANAAILNDVRAEASDIQGTSFLVYANAVNYVDGTRGNHVSGVNLTYAIHSYAVVCADVLLTSFQSNALKYFIMQ